MVLKLNQLTVRSVTANLPRGRYGDGGRLFPLRHETRPAPLHLLYRDRETGRQHELFLGFVNTIPSSRPAPRPRRSPAFPSRAGIRAAQSR